MKVAIVLFDVNLKEFDLSDSYIITCDRGTLNAINSGIKPDLAIGDFDSIDKDEFELVRKNSKELIRLNPIKDKTDVEEAFIKALEKTEDITIYGGIQGERIEHFLSIISLFNKDMKLRIVDNNSLIFKIGNRFQFKKEDYSKYKFVSFFLDKEGDITLDGFYYDLSNKHIDKSYSSLLVSNRMVKDNLIIDVNVPTLVIMSKLDNKNNLD